MHLILAIGAAATIACACTAVRDAPRVAGAFTRVVRVIDGDTIQLAGGERVRLIGVDTPETKHPKKPVQRFGREASEFTRRLVEGKRVRLEYDQKRWDKYGRALAYVFLEDGTFVNAENIRRGYGFAYTRFPFPHLEEFRRLEREAREGERGLWAGGDVAEPAPSTAKDQSRCTSDRPIKGNVRRDGECVYHLPEGRDYARTTPERCFASEAEALAAGCRRSKKS